MPKISKHAKQELGLGLLGYGAIAITTAPWTGALGAVTGLGLLGAGAAILSADDHHKKKLKEVL
jgi:hypothetical protein